MVSTLLSHYWTADEPAELRRLQMRDWLKDLSEFPVAAVEGACDEWRQTHNRRPSPADIRILAIAEQMKHAPKRQAPLQVTDMHREPMPGPDVVRPGWRKIPHSLLTAAERKLFEESGSLATRHAFSSIAKASSHTVPLAAHEDRRPLPKIETHALLAEDDPAVQEQLIRLG